MVTRTSGDAVETFKVDGADTLTYSDTALAADTAYSYEIKAVDDVDAEAPTVIAVYAVSEIKTLADVKTPDNDDNQSDKTEDTDKDSGKDSVKTGVAGNIVFAMLLFALATGTVVVIKKKSYAK